MFDNVQLINPDRDEAWAIFIDRPDVQAHFQSNDEFKFPLDKSYDLWCVCWDKAWNIGFTRGHDSANERNETIELAYQKLSMIHSELMHEMVELQNRLQSQQTMSDWWRPQNLWWRIKALFGRRDD